MEANFIDCRINAYPEHTEYKGIVRYRPNFVFIDLNLSTFSKYKDPQKALNRSLKNTLKKISTLVEEGYTLKAFEPPMYNDNNNNHIKNNQDLKSVSPTVLWTGNGYHIYLPIHAMVLDLIDQDLLEYILLMH